MSRRRSRRRSLRRRLEYEAITRVGGGALTALMRSARYEVEGREHYDATWGSGRPAVLLLWHGRLLPCSFAFRHQGLGTLISRHRDGDYIARVVEGWGFHPVRGSSSRDGSTALRQIVRVLRGGRAVAITPDGPRGPRQRMKSGPVLAAQMAGVPLLCGSAGVSRAWWFDRGWDRFVVPKPFARVRVALAEPIPVPADADEQQRSEIERRAERVLNELTERLDAQFA